MRNIDIEPGSAAMPFDEGYLSEVEDSLGVKFPPTYVSFLAMENGGIPVLKFFDFYSNVKVLERFLSLVMDYKNDALGIYDIEVVWSQIEDRLEENVWPFAVVFAGDFLCFDSRDSEVARVVLWDHNRSVPGRPHLTPVADDFDSFLAMLHG